jgi:hypothetical protein
MLDEPFYPLYFLTENARPREKERERERNDMLVQTILRTSLPLYLLYLARIREHTCARHSYSQSRFSFSRGSLIFFFHSLTPHQVERLIWQRLAGRHRVCRGPRSAFVGLSHIEVVL